MGRWLHREDYAKANVGLHQWEDNRKQWLMQEGKLQCNYARIYLPKRIMLYGKEIFGLSYFWTFMKTKFETDRFGNITDEHTYDENLSDIPLIQDYPILEADWINPTNPFSIFSGYEELIKWRMDIHTPKGLHVGLLTIDAMDLIITKCKGHGTLIDTLDKTQGLVFYYPGAFSWDVVGSWRETLIDEEKTNKTIQKKNNLLKSAVAAAAALII